MEISQPLLLKKISNLSKETTESLKMELIANIVPIAGVLFFGWSALLLLLVYWMENVVLGLYQALKLIRTRVNYPANAQNELAPGPLRPIQPAEHWILTIFFCIHYGGFTFGHFVLLGVIGEDLLNEPLQWHWGMAPTVLSFLYVHGRAYYHDFVLTKAYEKKPLTQLFFSPYRRILVTHTTLLLGMFPLVLLGARFPQVAVVLIFIKIFIDIKSQQKEAELWRTVDKLQQPPAPQPR